MFLPPIIQILKVWLWQNLSTLRFYCHRRKPLKVKTWLYKHKFNDIVNHQNVFEIHTILMLTSIVSEKKYSNICQNIRQIRFLKITTKYFHGYIPCILVLTLHHERERDNMLLKTWSFCCLNFWFIQKIKLEHFCHFNSVFSLST